MQVWLRPDMHRFFKLRIGQPGDAWEMCAKLVRNVHLMRMNKSHPSLHLCSSHHAIFELPQTSVAKLLSAELLMMIFLLLMIYDINHELRKWRKDRRSERNLCNCVKKPEKKNFSGFFTQLHKLCSLRRSFLDFDIFIRIQIKLIFTKEVRHSASFWKWEFLELGNGLLSFKILILEKVLFSKVRKYPGGYFLVYATKWGRIFTTGLTIMGLHFFKSL